MTRHRQSWNIFSRILDRLSDYAIDLLTRPLKTYTLHIPNDMAALKRYVRKGDVILVEGNERISECIKYLTQSSWSHAALYVGDEPIRRNPALKSGLVTQFGDEAKFLMVEALVESGVVLSPVAKYRDFNMRISRPYSLSPADLAEIMDEALRAVGDTYDLRNVVDLARFFLPVSLVPRRFHRVAFPIIPNYAQLPSDAMHSTRTLRLWPIGARQPEPSYGIMRVVSPTLITPRDFDLSPYFEIIKFNIIENMRFDYHKILWADDEAPTQPIKKEA